MKRFHAYALPVFAVLMTTVLAGCGGPNLIELAGGGLLGYGICGGVILILDIIALVQIAGTDWAFKRKAIWALIIIFFPVGGLILWWLFGK
ncbi:MAG: PLDc N-terminal domain-containing protein [Rhodothermales bacterium]|nr:PLDc N-terminal domain-containing protein [Rhodothermales bacterium]MBO6778281.1 PLDc N-terminal domain-containing protein [Rhodothermales bacterium]